MSPERPQSYSPGEEGTPSLLQTPRQVKMHPLHLSSMYVSSPTSPLFSLLYSFVGELIIFDLLIFVGVYKKRKSLSTRTTAYEH